MDFSAPITMKAVILNSYGKAADVLKTGEWPDPTPKSGEVLIRVEGFGLNYADIMARKGLYGAAPKPPCILGYEVVGEVVETVSERDAHLLGKRVIAFTRFGGYAELAVTNGQAAFEIGTDINLGEALALCTQYATAWYALSRFGNLREGERILVHAAAGGVGQALIQFAALKKCRIIALAGSDAKINFLNEQYKIEHAINYQKQNYLETLEELLGNRPLDLSLNSVAGNTFKKDVQLLGAGGRLILYGASSRSDYGTSKLATFRLLWNMGLMIPIQLMMKSISVAGLNMLKIGDERPDQLRSCMAEVLKMFEEGLIKPVVDEVFPVSEVSEAHQRMEDRKSLGKIAVRW